jgi:hypothetical protein
MQFIVLSMHRSGSSVASRLLNMMGLYLGAEDSMMLPQSDNSVGFWERQDVADINDLVLSRYGASWDNVYPLPTTYGYQNYQCHIWFMYIEILSKLHSHCIDERV